jgi:alpha-2-macroglobulin
MLRRAALLLVLTLFVLPPAIAETPEELLATADRLFEEKNYQEAADAYEALLDGGATGTTLHHASRRLIASRIRLSLFGDALEAAKAWVERTRGTPYEARAERFLGNLYLTVPHWGTRAGGEFHRNQWMQGIAVRSHRMDKKLAVKHLTRARELYAEYDAAARSDALEMLPEKERKAWHEERLGCLFDLAGAVSRFGIYEASWLYWHAFWAERDDFTAETAGEEDFDEYHPDWQVQRNRPIGLRIAADGQPRFPTKPKTWQPDAADDEKLLYLLAEVRELDQSDDRRFTAVSWYRQAMLARSRFGMDRLNGYASLYWAENVYPLQEELKNFKPYELGDHEALVLAGGRIQKTTLPTEWDVLALLRTVAGDYRESKVAPEAAYTIGLYHQTRQQYTEALAAYDRVLGDFATAPWDAWAKQQTAKIKASQVSMAQSGIQLPGRPAKLSLSYRNVEKIHFTARRIDLAGFFEELRSREPDPDKGFQYFGALSRWHHYFVYGSKHKQEIYQLAGKRVGPEEFRWSVDVVDDGTHRYAATVHAAPLADRGAYLVQAWLTEPGEKTAKTSGSAALDLGISRSVVVLCDLALVERVTDEGNLFFVCNAETGAPVPGAEVKALEVWSVYKQKPKKHDYFKTMHEGETDEQGIALIDRHGRHSGNTHVLVSVGEGRARRIAFSGMMWWTGHSSSQMKEGGFAWCVTDRPVYRPGQKVKFKVWLRRMKDGVYQEPRNERSHLEVYDTRGNKVFETNAGFDEYGGLEGEFTLGEEPPLGMYRFVASGRRYGGYAQFRVEEYKKPEFEVTVEPGKDHARLGEKLMAKVKATYYFGGPVTEATVKYKVFREEYRHRYWFPGRWDWLYGPGYGLVWYDYHWFPWWGLYRRCCVPPPWWWGYYGGTPGNPVRELVKEGDAPIGEDGTLDVEIDTGPALSDHGDLDHRYVIQAEVRDMSRRVITGEGSVLATRQAFYAVLQADRGYYRPGDEIRVKVRTMTPGGAPVKAAGVVTISEVGFAALGNAELREVEVDRFPAETDERGFLELNLRHEKSGQLRITFETPDQWGGVVEGNSLVWVAGSDFDGEFQRFNDLEVITDRRIYQPGETAHVMVNTNRAGSFVLFADEVDNNHLLSWRLIEIKGRSTVVDVPVTRGGRPNFFVEATTVSDARVHSQIRRICVPPEDGVIDVKVSTDRPEYGPGDEAEITVTATTPDGKPARAQVAISAFDRSVLYIQPELAPTLATFFHGRMRQHAMVSNTNLTEVFSTYGYVRRPFQDLYPVPAAWFGAWGANVTDWGRFGDRELMDMGAAQTLDGYASSGRGGYRGPAGEVAPSGASSVGMGIGGGVGGGVGGVRKAAETRSLDRSNAKGPAGPGGGAPLVEATVRSKFADTALWLGHLETGEDGTATAKFNLPENLTTWKVNAWSMTKDTRVGQADTSALTTKDLLVRLQAPRFFLEYDEVVISANVHNYLETEKAAEVTLVVPPDLLKLIGKVPATTRVTVPAGGEKRVDWRVKVRGEGRAEITVKALTEEESDAMQMTFPVLVHGMMKQVASTGSIRPDEDTPITVKLDVPHQRRPELTSLTVKYSPSLVGAMLDALPYCLDYPYGCTEQTVSRFLPAVLTLKTLQNMGIKLEDVKKVREGRMEELRRIAVGEHQYHPGYADLAIFDDEGMKEIISLGLQRITSMQNGDGGWGWWKRDDSSPYLTAYVLYALTTAVECDVAVDQQMIARGLQFLLNYEASRLRNESWSPHASHAFSALLLAGSGQRAAIEPVEGDERPGDLVERLWLGRDRLGLYGKALLVMTLAKLGEEEKARAVLRNCMQHLERNDETEIAWFRTPQAHWWYWWNNDIETNAWLLRALVAIEPKSDVAPRLVKWLLNNRRNGTYWRSTRDTTLCVSAMSDFVVASGEGEPDYTLTLDLDDGAVVKKVKITKDNFFTYDNSFVVAGLALSGGSHTLKITREGRGAVYAGIYLKYFTKEEFISAAGHELHVNRTYYHLRRIPYEVEVDGADGQKLTEKRLRYERVPLAQGDLLKSGDLIQVELEVESDNDYTYFAIEDPKPAGCEPVDVRSGGARQEGFSTYRELRDEKVVFFASMIGQGKHLLRYRLRAEIPGLFHALPTKLFGMYVPELAANSDEMILLIED